MNQYTACGNLADTPLLRTTPSGRPVTNFLLIVDERLKKNGPRAQMRKERTIAHRIPVVAWGDLAETVTTWLQKGSKILREKENLFQLLTLFFLSLHTFLSCG